MAKRFIREILTGGQGGLELQVVIELIGPIDEDGARQLEIVHAIAGAVETAAAVERFPVPLGRLEGGSGVRRS